MGRATEGEVEAGLAKTLADERPRASPRTSIGPETPGRYTIEAVLGEGGQSTVSVAYDTHLARRVAFKQPHGTSDASLDRFVEEARVTARLEHPNIVPVHEIGRREDGSYYCTQKMIGDGEATTTLLRAIHDASDLSARLRLLPHFVDLCHAVAFAHEHGILHRDIKPDNVMLGSFGETVLLDWGLAVSREDASNEGRLVGTPSYMSPEQARGASVDERTDVWSLGAVLFEILTGRPPFEGHNALNVVSQVLASEVPEITAFESGAPAQLVAIAARALERNEDARYRCASQMAEDVLAFQSGNQVSVYDYSVIELLGLFVSRHRGVSIATAIAFALLVVAGIINWQSYRRAEDYLAEARINLAHALVQQARESEGRLEWDRAAAYYAAARVQHDDAFTRWGARLSSGRLSSLGVTRHEGHTRRILDLAHSPDGRLLGSAAGDGTVRLWSPEGECVGAIEIGSPNVQAIRFLSTDTFVTGDEDGRVARWGVDGRSVLLFDHDEPVEALDVSHDGRLVAVGSADMTVRILDAASGQVLAQWTQTGGPVFAVHFLPGDRGLLSGGWDRVVRHWQIGHEAPLHEYVGHSESVFDLGFASGVVYSASRDRTIRVWDLETTETIRVLGGHRQRVSTLALSPDGAWLASGGTDQQVRVWDARHGHALLGLSFGHEDEVRTVSFNPDGRTLAWAGSRHVWIRELRGDAALAHAADRVQVIRHVGDDGALVGWSPEGVSTWDVDGARRAWDSEAVPVSPRDIAVVHSVAYTHCADKVPCAIDLDSGHHRTIGDARASVVHSFAVDHTASLLAVGEASGLITLLHLPDGQEVGQLEGHGDGVFGLAFSPDGARLASASWDQTVRVWEVESRRELGVGSGHEHGVRRVAFSPDGTRVASASWDETVRVWDAATVAPIATLQGHDDYVFDVAYSHDGEYLVSGSWDGTVRVWASEDGRELARYVTDEARVFAVSVMPNGRGIAYAGHAIHHVRFGELGAARATLETILDRTQLELDGVELSRRRE